MKGHRFKLEAVLILLCLCGPWAIPAQAEVTFHRIHPGMRKTPIAVPAFKTVTGNPEEKILSVKAADLLADTLEFTGYFKMIDRGAFLFDPEKDGVTSRSINFRNWTVIGAEILITGDIKISGGNIEMTMRLFDTFKGRMLIGKKYSAALTQQRKMIRLFCSEVIYYLTGLRSFFESKIAFVSTGTGHKEIYISEFDGYKPRRFTNNKSISLFPAWSSNGEWMAYTSYRKGQPDLYIRQLNGRRMNVVDKQGINITPAWVPGKFSLAATLSFSGDQEIYLLTGTGKIIKRLTGKRGSDVSPTWSPDGKKFAFVSSRSGNPQVYIKEINSNRIERITFEGKYNTQPNWSPAGNKIVFSSMQGGEINIFVFDLKTGATRQLTRYTGNNEAPSFSPDGTMIVFSSNREGPFRIYVMTAYGMDQRRLLALAGEQTNPKWSPNIVEE